jgi:nucleotide-binding universal stress UspA family protein
VKLATILVPVDGSALAESAIATAVDMARPGASTIILMRAAEAHTLPGVDPTDAQVQIVGEAEGYLAGVWSASHGGASRTCRPVSGTGQPRPPSSTPRSYGRPILS